MLCSAKQNQIIPFSSSFLFLLLLVLPSSVVSLSKEIMEVINDLFVTASLALALSFLVAKLVSMAMGDRDSHSPTAAGDVISMGESLLRVQTHQSERKVQVPSPESLKEVDGFTENNVTAAVENVEVEHHPESDHVGLPLKSSEEDVVSEELSVSDVFEIMEEKREEEEHGNRETATEPEKEEIALVKERDEEEREVKMEFVEEEDDWEGIERSELEKVFMAATQFVAAGNNNERLASIGSDEQVELYGLHKLATEGPCRDPQPMPFMLSARAKWNAWQKLGNMNPEVAMEQYITLLSDKVPGWMEDNSAGKGDQELNKSELFDSAAVDSSNHQENLITERDTFSCRELEQQSGAKNCSLLVESDLGNQVKNDGMSASIL